MKLQDIDWQHNQICVNQAKTHKKVYIPLIDDIGNALVDYLLNERYSKSKSEYVFLVQKAPYIPLISHSGCRDILEKIERLSGTITDNRIIGSRMTRHTYASYLLRHGVSLAIIAQALGHRSVDVTMRYLSTDEAALAQCTLPLPTCSLNENEAKS